MQHLNHEITHDSLAPNKFGGRFKRAFNHHNYKFLNYNAIVEKLIFKFKLVKPVERLLFPTTASGCATRHDCQFKTRLKLIVHFFSEFGRSNSILRQWDIIIVFRSHIEDNVQLSVQEYGPLIRTVPVIFKLLSWQRHGRDVKVQINQRHLPGIIKKGLIDSSAAKSSFTKSKIIFPCGYN